MDPISFHNSTSDKDSPSESASRVRMLAQERDKQLQRRYQSNNHSLSQSQSEPGNILATHQGQFTPAIRQFSTPKGVAKSYLK